MTRSEILPGVRFCRAAGLVALLASAAGPGRADDVAPPPRPTAAPRGKLEATVDRIVGAEMSRHHTPGLVIAVIDHGKVALLKAYGTRRLLGPPVSADTLFSVGSLSKVMTAYGALLLVDQQKLDLDKPAKTYLKGLPPAWREITPRQFLTHTSGIPQVQPAARFDLVLLKSFHDPLRFAPGTGQDYNDFNYAVIGKMIEAISGQRILDYLAARLFKPLGMTSTGNELARRDRAVGYLKIPNGLRPAPIDPLASTYLFAASGLESTMNDLLKLDAAIRTRQLLRPGTFEAMWKPAVPAGKKLPWSYSPGWQSFLAGTTPVFANGGRVNGFRSFYEIVPDKELSLLALYNLNTGDNSFWQPAAKILREVYRIAPAKGVKGGEE